MVQQDPMYDPAALNLHSREAQHTNAGENRASKGTIRDAVRAVIEGFETDPTATMSLPLHRNLQAYHSQLIALGSAIGTGLFIGAGQGLRVAGPIPLMLAFTFVGFTLCPTVFALGEMATLMPFAGGFIEHSRMFVDDAWGAAVGWNYAFQWLITLPLELVAACITLQYWGAPLGHRAVWVTIFLMGIATINIFGVKGWANVEAALSVLKVAAIVGSLILGVLIDAGLGFKGLSIGTYNWYHPGAIHHGFWGFCSVMITAAFAYSGSEMVGLTAREQVNPRRDMPKAIKKVFIRIGIFYIASIFMIGLLVPYNDESLLGAEAKLGHSASPFVIATQRAGIRVLPSLFNAVIIITVLSVANSSVYGSSRVLNSLADRGLAPKAFAYVDKVGRPLRCFYLSGAFGLLAYLVELKQQTKVFLWLLGLCGLSSIISWTSICVTHLRFRKALEIEIQRRALDDLRPRSPLETNDTLETHIRSLDDLPFRSPLGTIGTWVGLFCNLFIIVIQFLTAVFPVGWHHMPAHLRAQSFFSSFMAFPLLGVVYVGFKYFKGTYVAGVRLTWRHGIQLNKPHVIWGEGTHLVDLASVSFQDAFELEDYTEDPEVPDNELWWCPGGLREPLRRIYFPW